VPVSPPLAPAVYVSDERLFELFIARKQEEELQNEMTVQNLSRFTEELEHTVPTEPRLPNKNDVVKILRFATIALFALRRIGWESTAVMLFLTGSLLPLIGFVVLHRILHRKETTPALGDSRSAVI
jgi:hypothetical protein